MLYAKVVPVFKKNEFRRVLGTENRMDSEKKYICLYIFGNILVTICCQNFNHFTMLIIY